jgi:membrane associated rhomboid family serine protease
MAAVPAAPDARSQRHGAIAAALLVLQAVVLLWAIELVDQVVLGEDLDELGIEPRETDGLVGVVLAPLLHGGFGHLVANTVPLLVLGTLVALGGRRRLVAVTAIVALFGGTAVWAAGPQDTVHIGASGVVFGFALYLATRGLFERSLTSIALGVLVLVLFGGTLLGGLVPQEGISWQGHLFGGMGGVLAARVLAPDPR